MKDCQKRGRSWACRPCDKARRAIISEYERQGQKHVWGKMSKDNKNAEIKKHKGKAPGRGKTFPVEITEQVGVPVQRFSVEVIFPIEVFDGNFNDCF